MSNEKLLQQLKSESQDTMLSLQEKQEMRLNLLEFMKEYPVKPSKPKQQWYATFINTIAVRPPLKYSFLVAMVFLMGGAGISFAAQNSLPGDFLYPVKTQITEKVLAFTLFSDELKAQNDINLISRRFEELETVSSKNNLDDKKSAQVNALIDGHIADVKIRIDNLKKQGQVNAGIETNSQLEASLDAHAQVLHNLSGEENTITASSVKNILSNIKDKKDSAQNARKTDESQLSAGASAQAQFLAQQKLKEVSNQMQQLLQLIDYRKTDISPATYAFAQAGAKVISDSIMEGNMKFQEKEYDGAFILFQDALRKIQEINIYVSNEASLKLDVSVKNKLPVIDQDNNGATISNILKFKTGK